MLMKNLVQAQAALILLLEPFPLSSELARKRKIEPASAESFSILNNSFGDSQLSSLKTIWKHPWPDVTV